MKPTTNFTTTQNRTNPPEYEQFDAGERWPERYRDLYGALQAAAEVRRAAIEEGELGAQSVSQTDPLRRAA